MPRRQRVAQPASEDLRALSKILAAPAPQRPKLLAGFVRKCLSTILRVPAADVSMTRPLRDQGLDSLMAVELAATLNRHLGLSLSKVVVWQHPVPAALVAAIASELEPEPEPEPESEVRRVEAEAGGLELDALLSLMESISDDDAVALLGAR